MSEERHRAEPDVGGTTHGDDSDLRPVLAYLHALGWEDVYAPAPRERAYRATAATPAASAMAPSGVAAGSGLRAAREALRQGVARGAGGEAETASNARPGTRGAGVPALAAGAPARAPAGTDGAAASAGDRAAAGSAGPTALPEGSLPATVLAALAALPPLPAPDRAARLAEVAAHAGSCLRCRLGSTRRSVVFASGNPDADLMFVGEGPGAEEDRQGLPFVGPAGQLLTKIIQAIGLDREQVYIANVVKCRPPGNRDPQPDEVAACRALLEAQVKLVQPKVLVALGRVAGQTLLGADLPVARLRGHWHQLLGVPLRVTYHPAAILRDASLKRPTWEDMQVVRDRLAGP